MHSNHSGGRISNLWRWMYPVGKLSNSTKSWSSWSIINAMRWSSWRNLSKEIRSHVCLVVSVYYKDTAACCSHWCINLDIWEGTVPTSDWWMNSSVQAWCWRPNDATHATNAWRTPIGKDIQPHWDRFPSLRKIWKNGTGSCRFTATDQRLGLKWIDIFLPCFVLVEYNNMHMKKNKQLGLLSSIVKSWFIWSIHQQ